MKRLNNKTAVITGGTTGIGFATARLFLQEGARVIITGRDQARLTKAREKLGENVIALKADVRSQSNLDTLASRVKEEFGNGEVNEIAKAAVFLASDESSYMSASDLVVDGGYMNV